VSYDAFVRDHLPPPDLLPEFRFDLPELQYPERLNAASELIKGGPRNSLAVINDHGRWTYSDLDDFSGRIARLLVEEHVTQASTDDLDIAGVHDPRELAVRLWPIEEIAARYSDGEITRLDGISVDYPDWHFNVRPSNTEPLLRLNLESLVSREDMEAKRDEVLGLIRA